MRKNVRLKLWGLLWVFIFIFIFILLSYFVQTNFEFFEGLIIEGWIGMLSYVMLKIVATVVAPITVLPLIVLAAGLWGVWVAAFLTVLGWTIGSVIDFGLARKFGVPIIHRFIPLEEIYKFEDKVKVGNTFWSVVLLRMIIPVDILSYALGLFSRINFWKYVLATFIGVIPFAFAFAYLGGMSYVYQIIFGLIFLIGILGYMIFREIKN